MAEKNISNDGPIEKQNIAETVTETNNFYANNMSVQVGDNNTQHIHIHVPDDFDLDEIVNLVSMAQKAGAKNVTLENADQAIGIGSQNT